VITLLLPPAEFQAAEARVAGAAYRHLFRARRLAVGERLRVVDGAGAARWAEVARVTADAALLRLGEPAPARDPSRRVAILVGCPRPERAAWLVEKASELGVAAVRFLACERSARTFGTAGLERLRRVAAAALEQSHGARLPELTGVHPWSELPALLAPIPERVLLDPEAAAWPAPPVAPAVALLVGPEGGWTDAERAALHALGCRPASLGPRALRVETAAIAAAALVLAAP
jgi:16S rRNA (uracil1498-N3)-methyltransferase